MENSSSDWRQSPACWTALRLSDGRRLLIPREELGELKNATPEQATDLKAGALGVDIWWPQLDDGLYLPDFLGYLWGKERRVVAA